MKITATKIYVISGLGVDQRVFSKIDFGSLDLTYLDWITPSPNEPLSIYAKRISTKITAKNPILVGLSFGGMLAIEIAKIIETKQIILLASAKGRHELTKLYRLAGRLKINKLVPSPLLKFHCFLSDYFFGIRNKEDSRLLKQILYDTDPIFMNWAIHQILQWKNNSVPDNLIHIHGSKDHIIPIKNVKPNFIIKGAGHFMTVTHAQEVEKLLQEICL
ncbi:alpha/beta hydrolase [Sphingobacterium sp. Ag1]|uniref:alpha/beta fold hydrolase n=1 Tax=Sphingobacterium sp. Ag1 TaxID=1643451 RepID=UPI00062750F9|nr:alpha/beta hydrolase [Sphingobacterium sp. Ag1]KKO88736.1 alpha/beta hydrolase [Sphingobacterium sp. Ag1]